MSEILSCKLALEAVHVYFRVLLRFHSFFRHHTFVSRNVCRVIHRKCDVLPESTKTIVPCCWNDGQVNNSQALPSVVAPPCGYRSAPALGGVGAGSAELRADGSFREWTILNQGPAGSGKYGLVDDFWMAAYANGRAKMLRTTPPAYGRAMGAAVDALNFSGTYPLTRLQVLDSALGESVNMEVFGYSKLQPGSLKNSSHPALVLTMKVHNPSDTTPVTTALMCVSEWLLYLGVGLCLIGNCMTK